MQISMYSPHYYSCRNYTNSWPFHVSKSAMNDVVFVLTVFMITYHQEVSNAIFSITTN